MKKKKYSFSVRTSLLITYIHSNTGIKTKYHSEKANITIILLGTFIMWFISCCAREGQALILVKQFINGSDHNAEEILDR